MLYIDLTLNCVHVADAKETVTLIKKTWHLRSTAPYRHPSFNNHAPLLNFSFFLYIYILSFVLEQ